MGRPRLIAACLAAVALYLVLPASSALAATAPPGNSEVNQYAETLPGGGGENTVNPPGSGPGGGGNGAGQGQGGGAPVIPAQTQRQLNQLGPDGQAAAALAEANAPQLPPGAPANGAGGGGGGAGKGDSVVGAVSGALSGSDQGGMGAFLPIALFGVAGLGIGYALARRRARQLG